MFQYPPPIYPTSTSSYPEPSSSSVNATVGHNIALSSAPSSTESPSPSEFNFFPSKSGITSTSTTPSSTASPVYYELPCELASPSPIALAVRPATVVQATNQTTATSSTSMCKREAPAADENAPDKAPKRKRVSRAATSKKLKRRANDRCPDCQEPMQTTSIARHCRTACPMGRRRKPFECECGCGFSRADALSRHRRHKHKGHRPPPENVSGSTASPSISSSVSLSAERSPVPPLVPSHPFTFRATSSSSTSAIPGWQQHMFPPQPTVPQTIPVSLLSTGHNPQFPLTLPQGQSVPVRVLAGNQLLKALHMSQTSGQKIAGVGFQDERGNQYIVQPLDPHTFCSYENASVGNMMGGNMLDPFYHQGGRYSRHPAQESVNWYEDETALQENAMQATSEPSNPPRSEESTGYVNSGTRSASDVGGSGTSGEYTHTHPALETYNERSNPPNHPWIEEEGAYAAAQVKVDSMVNSKFNFADPCPISLSNASVEDPSFAAWMQAEQQGGYANLIAREESQVVDPLVSPASLASFQFPLGFTQFPGSFSVLPETTICE